MDLCCVVLQENQIDGENLDKYLNYVHEEEANGKRFEEIEELMEDIVEYTKASALNWDPAIARFVAIGVWLLLIIVPVSYLISVFIGREDLKIMLLTVYAIIILIYGTGFAAYHKARKKYLKENEEK